MHGLYASVLCNLVLANHALGIRNSVPVQTTPIELKSNDKFVVLATDKCFSVKLSFSERNSCVLLSLSDLFRRMLITSNGNKDDDNDSFEPPDTWTPGTCVYVCEHLVP